MYGERIYYFANGDRYHGNFIENIIYGEGIHYFANGDMETVDWDGIFVGDIPNLFPTM